MAWFRVDDQSAFHPKVVRAGNAAFGAWVRLGAYCNAQLTDGFVPEQVARLIASKREIDNMIAAGLLHPTSGGYEIHDYHDFQPASDEVKERRAQVAAKRAEAGRLGGKASGESRRSKLTSDSEASVKQIASCSAKQNEAPSRPDPVPSKDSVPHVRVRAMDAWREKTGNLVANPGDAIAMVDLIERACAEDGRTPEDYIVAFVEWQRSCPADRRPQLAPHKLVANFAAVQEWLRGERKPAPAPPSADNRPRRVRAEDLRYKDGV
jgi:hypothetical protein